MNESMDWVAYQKAQQEQREKDKAEGRLCYECGHWLMFPTGCRERCDQCKSLEDPKELRHHHKVRCPKCKESWAPADRDQYQLFEPGTHEVFCSTCDENFDVEVFAEYTFISPSIEKDPEESDAL